MTLTIKHNKTTETREIKEKDLINSELAKVALCKIWGYKVTIRKNLDVTTITAKYTDTQLGTYTYIYKINDFETRGL